MIEKLHEEMAEYPHNYKSILEDFSVSIDESSPAKVLSGLKFPGVFDQPRKHRYWVDDKNRNCFMVYAKALRINWGGNRYQWRWYAVKETSDAYVDVAELLRAYWLEVHGVFKTGYLTPETKYEVSYVIKMTDSNSGWENDVDFSLTLPQNPPSGPPNKKNLKQLQKGDWSYIRVDEFKPGQPGEMDFMLRQLGKLKTGLVIKGVAIRPTT